MTDKTKKKVIPIGRSGKVSVISEARAKKGARDVKKAAPVRARKDGTFPLPGNTIEKKMAAEKALRHAAYARGEAGPRTLEAQENTRKEAKSILKSFDADLSSPEMKRIIRAKNEIKNPKKTPRIK